jgi:hypothetical protein
MVKKEYHVFKHPIKLRFRGVYDMKGLMRLIYKWYSSSQYTYHETKYKDKQETVFGNEIEIEMEGNKKVTEYLRYYVKITTHQWESKDIVVKVGEKEVSMMQGRVEVQITAWIVTDWQDQFKKGTWWETAQNFMEKVVIMPDIALLHIDPLDKDLHALARDIKNHLKIESV